MGVKLDILEGRIETLDVDAVVNAANRGLIPGTGVDGAIRRAAGPELTAHTMSIAPVEEGEAKASPGFGLSARYVIHTVAPVWFFEGEDVDKVLLLGACYRNSIALAGELGLSSIAFPCIGTGNFGWPREIACPIAIENARAGAAEAKSIKRVVFCCFSRDDAEIYRAMLAAV